MRIVPYHKAQRQTRLAMRLDLRYIDQGITFAVVTGLYTAAIRSAHVKRSAPSERSRLHSGGFSCAHAERDQGRPQPLDQGDEREKPGPPTNPKKNRILEGFCLLSAVFIAIIL